MASFFGISKPGAKGIDIRTHTVTLKAHAAITKGQVVAVSRTITGLSAEADPSMVVFDTTAAPGTGNDGVDDFKCGIMAIALEDVAIGAEGKFALSGVVTAEYGSSVAVGDALSAAADLHLDKTANGVKVVGYALEAGTANQLKTILFDGLNGFSGNQDA